MDWGALRLSVLLGLATLLVLVPLAVPVGRWLARATTGWHRAIEGFILLPLVLPPTVMGFYILAATAPSAPFGRAWEALFGTGLAFSFQGLVLASVLVNLPFAVQPIARAFEGVGRDLVEAAAACGQTPFQAFLRVELPLAWPGILTGAILTFAHTLGEFGVVLMVGGAIPGETRTLSIAIYDRVQMLDFEGAGLMSLLLLLLSVAAIGLVFAFGGRRALGA